jgi:hypothetical protein
LAGRYDVGLDNRIMPEVAARVPPFASASEKIRPAGRVLQEAPPQFLLGVLETLEKPNLHSSLAAISDFN